MESQSGDFYVQQTCCMSCGVPQAIAPELVGWRDPKEQTDCYWIRQPQNSDELERAIQILDQQELGCHRYSGKDPEILRRLPATECDFLRPDMALKHGPLLGLSEIPVRFSLSVSEAGLFAKMWRKLTGQRS